MLDYLSFFPGVITHRNCPVFVSQIKKSRCQYLLEFKKRLYKAAINVSPRNLWMFESNFLILVDHIIRPTFLQFLWTSKSSGRSYSTS